MSLMLASVTDSLVTVATNAIDSLGLPGVALFMGLTATGVAFPGEATMLFAGFDVSDGHLSLAGILVAAWLGDLIGCLVGYAVGHYGREGILERHGAKVHLGPHRLAQGDRWCPAWPAEVPVVAAFATPLLGRSAGGWTPLPGTAPHALCPLRPADLTDA